MIAGRAAALVSVDLVQTLCPVVARLRQALVHILLAMLACGIAVKKREKLKRTRNDGRFFHYHGWGLCTGESGGALAVVGVDAVAASSAVDARARCAVVDVLRAAQTRVSGLCVRQKHCFRKKISYSLRTHIKTTAFIAKDFCTALKAKK